MVNLKENSSAAHSPRTQQHHEDPFNLKQLLRYSPIPRSSILRLLGLAIFLANRAFLRVSLPLLDLIILPRELLLKHSLLRAFFPPLTTIIQITNLTTEAAPLLQILFLVRKLNRSYLSTLLLAFVSLVSDFSL